MYIICVHVPWPFLSLRDTVYYIVCVSGGAVGTVSPVQDVRGAAVADDSALRQKEQEVSSVQILDCQT